MQRTLNVRVCISFSKTEFEEFNKKSSCDSDAAGFATYFDPGLISRNNPVTFRGLIVSIIGLFLYHFSRVVYIFHLEYHSRLSGRLP